jgi:hypothetical protein
VSALHEAVLDDGRRIVLLDDRGWGGRHIPSASVEELKRTAKVVVGPDEPFGGRSRTDMEAGHWEALAQTLREQGGVASAATLRGLPHHVELSDRLVARIDAQSAAQRREPE